MSPAAVVSRILAAIFGCYAFVWGVVALCVAALNGVGVEYHAAEQAMMILAFILYLVLFLWTFAAASLWRVRGVLASSSAALLVAPWPLPRLIAGQEENNAGPLPTVHGMGAPLAASGH